MHILIYHRDSEILRTDCIDDLHFQTDRKLHFHYHIDFILSNSLRLLTLIRIIAFSFSTLESLLAPYVVLVTSELEHAFVARNSVTVTNKLVITFDSLLIYVLNFTSSG
jgi:hypothetical protein